jgi:hypothetical protein
MGYRPTSPDPDKTIISYDAGKEDSVKEWEEAVDSFLNRKLFLVSILS